MRIFPGADLEPELGRDHHLPAHGSEGLAHEFFIHERTVDFRGIEERHAAFDRSPNERNHLPFRPRYRSVTGTQPHAAKAHGRDFKIAFSQFAFLHCLNPLHKSMKWIWRTALVVFPRDFPVFVRASRLHDELLAREFERTGQIFAYQGAH